MGLFPWFSKKHPVKSRISVVSFDEIGVRHQRPDGSVETVRWSELTGVIILTTDLGPAIDDVFWILAGTERANGCVAPSEAVGMAALIERLQRLPGFDNCAVIAAMTSIDNNMFLCWRRERST